MHGDGIDGAQRPAISLVVSTIGRPEALGRLLASLLDEFDELGGPRGPGVAAAGGVELELVVVDQDPQQRCLAVLQAAGLPFPWRHLTSGLGASVGRNVGLAAARGAIIGFPDDNAWFTGRTLASVLAVFAARPELGIVCGRQLTADGHPSMLRWAPTARAVTRANHHRTSIASTMFLRRRALEAIPWFNEDLGVGTATWYGACEESDLLLRAIYAGAPAWYEPDIVVLQDDPRDEPTPEFRTKMLRYGCGQGRLWRLHRVRAPHVAALLGRKVVKVLQLLARRQVAGAGDELAWIHGALCGLVDRPPRAFAGRPTTSLAPGAAPPGPPPGWGQHGDGEAPAGVPVDASTGVELVDRPPPEDGLAVNRGRGQW